MFQIMRLAPAILAMSWAGESDWKSVWTPHFIVHYESSGYPRSFNAELEKIFRGLRRELWALSSWMDTEKVEVYLYAGQESYVSGRFNPPPWSAGIVYYSGRRGSAWSLAVFEPAEQRTVAHELTHLYFKSFFQQNPGRIPLWLNEGLAEMTAGEAVGSRPPSSRGPPIAKAIPVQVFLKMSALQDPRGARDFYPQAHSMVRFLKKAHSPFKFARFCRELRDGAQAERALFSVYGYRTPEHFEKAWKKWAGAP